MSLACIKMKMLPTEAINAATINGACALEVQDKFGSIAKGKVANLIVTDPIPSYDFIPYAFGSDLIRQIILRGQLVSPDVPRILWVSALCRLHKRR